jgi:hypothetical protein
MNAVELHMDDTISHTDGLELKQGLPSDEVHKRALAARNLYGKVQKALTFWIMEMDERKLYNDFGEPTFFSMQHAISASESIQSPNC